MHASQLRQRYLAFFHQQGHAVIAAAPLVPENDPSVLFTTAGMHPLVPYLLGEPHPAGKRLANVQPCLRTGDIDEVGDDTHLTCFEMLGNWSLGDYGKAEAIIFNYTLLTEIFGYDPARLHVTCFAGDTHAPRDEEAAACWRALGIPSQRIHFLPRSDNWWGPVGNQGPCGPDSEVFFDRQPGGDAAETPANAPGRFVEIANNVFMIYEQQPDGTIQPLAQPAIDVGVGLERNLMVLTGAASVFDTDLFLPILAGIRAMAQQPDSYAERVIADHVRAATLLLAEGVRPGNADQPYVLRRLIRRAVRYGRQLGISEPFLGRLVAAVAAGFDTAYPLIDEHHDQIVVAFEEEERRFARTLARGERLFAESAAVAHTAGEQELAGDLIFRLYDTYGFPLELTAELARQAGLMIDTAGFHRAYAAHQERSRAGAAGRFAGGLAERNPHTTRLHTATHLLQAALRHVLGPHVVQRGSNITAERLRFDFSHPERLNAAQLAAVETFVNQQINADLPVEWHEMTIAEAHAAGAIGVFEERYGERVKVYRIGTVSLEVCGGPHVAHTGELGRLRIMGEEGVGLGVRRIKAVLASTE
ncbi:MAG TPA: alanine--tRNA ligase [Roseiflexaceae bacterium]|nr:alanine--tRNA ligase [Roseiflexaceae bacterium]